MTPSNQAPESAEVAAAMEDTFEAAKEGDVAQRLKLLEQLTDEVEHSFSGLFFPSKPMHPKNDEEPSESTTKVTIVATLEDKVWLDAPTAADALPESHDVLLEQLLVAAEMVVLSKLREDALDEAIDISDPTSVLAIASLMDYSPTHMWVGPSVLLEDILTAPLWVALSSEGISTPECITTGLAREFHLNDRPMQLYVDMFRYDTLRVLEDREWYLFAAEGPETVWLNWLPISYENNQTTMKLELRHNL